VVDHDVISFTFQARYFIHDVAALDGGWHGPQE
jgi:hypothetical protein